MPPTAWGPSGPFCRRWTWPTSCARKACRCSPWRAAGPVADFDVVGITLPHELAATNVLETLDLAGIPLRTVDRAEGDPIVLAGGPCAYNPEPYAPFFDVILVGEGEEQLPKTLALIRELRASGAPRAEILREVARRVGGAYVPSLYRWRNDDEAQAAGSWAEPLFDDVPRCGAQARLRGFRRQPGARAHDRALYGSGARPAERRDPTRLRAGLPLLSGGHDVPPGAGALGRQHRGRRGPGPRRDRLRRGEPDLALLHGSLADRRDPLAGERRLRRGRRARERALPAPGRLRGGDGRARGRPEEGRSHLRARGRHPAAARRHQQERHRGRPVRAPSMPLSPPAGAAASCTSWWGCPPRPTTTSRASRVWPSAPTTAPRPPCRPSSAAACA